MDQQDTIITLSSGQLPSGVAVLRLSGAATRHALADLGVECLTPRHASLVSLVDGETDTLIDRAILLWFPGPASFTGEDVAELHVHGGLAVVSSLMEIVCRDGKVRPAEAGEFSRRAFANGKMDLTEVEGLADLLSAETEAQRKLALSQSQGALREKYEGWRSELIRALAMIEAELDFVEEDDVPEDASTASLEDLAKLRRDMLDHLDDNRAGEIIRDGFSIVVLGPPNAGKSSLLNHLAKREVAIVTEEAGTTRDAIDVVLDIGGYRVVMTDTAGLRETDNRIEAEGIRRAHERAIAANMVLWLQDKDDAQHAFDLEMENVPVLALKTKDDQGELPVGTSLSVETGHGIDWVMTHLEDFLGELVGNDNSGLMTRARHRSAIEAVVSRITTIVGAEELDQEIAAEELRSAADAMSRLTGRIDTEDLLDVIFSEFCVGK